MDNSKLNMDDIKVTPSIKIADRCVPESTFVIPGYVENSKLDSVISSQALICEMYMRDFETELYKEFKNTRKQRVFFLMCLNVFAILMIVTCVLDIRSLGDYSALKLYFSSFVVLSSVGFCYSCHRISFIQRMRKLVNSVDLTCDKIIRNHGDADEHFAK